MAWYYSYFRISRCLVTHAYLSITVLKSFFSRDNIFNSIHYSSPFIANQGIHETKLVLLLDRVASLYMELNSTYPRILYFSRDIRAAPFYRALWFRMEQNLYLKFNKRGLRGRPFDSEGGGGHFLEINILTLKMLEINNFVLFWKENK